MKTFATAVFLVIINAFPLVQNQSVPSEKLVCHGEYSSSGKDYKGVPQTKKLDEWHMYVMPDGSYAVDIDMLVPGGPAKITEHLVFTTDLKPTAFGETATPPPGGSDKPVEFHCDYGESVLSCQSSFENVSASATLNATMPYTFWPGVDPPVNDVVWAMQALASEAVRSVGHPTEIPLICIEDERDNRIQLKVQETETVEYLGQENLQVMGQTVDAQKFRIQAAGKTGSMDIWLSHSGILLQASFFGTRIALTAYQGPTL
jgi:hypothetical protein